MRLPQTGARNGGAGARLQGAIAKEQTVENYRPSCVDCALNTCGKKEGDRFPAFCPTKDFSLDSERELNELMQDDLNRRMFVSAAHSAHVGYREKLSRLDETILFARGIEARKIGIAACISLSSEARFAAKALRTAGFEVFGVICKTGHLTCADCGIPLEGRSPDTALCNPIYQAQMLNAEHTDLNVVIGLCAGHDALFMKHADAPCTVMIVKDFKYDHHSVLGLRSDS